MIDWNDWCLEVKEGFSICHCLDPWGETMLYYGLYHNHIYTEGYESLKTLVAEFPELQKAMKRRG